MSRLFLNSIGLNTKDGAKQIKNSMKVQGITDLSDQKIFVVLYTPYGVDDLIVKNCIEILGFQSQNIFLSKDGVPEADINYVYVTEGNVFQVLNYMRENQLVDYIQNLILNNDHTDYIGSSAGAMIAGKDIYLGLDFDKNNVRMIDFTSLNLFDGTIIPHYEKENLEMYKRNTEEKILNRYEDIYCVNDDEVLVIDILIRNFK